MSDTKSDNAKSRMVGVAGGGRVLRPLLPYVIFYIRGYTRTLKLLNFMCRVGQSNGNGRSKIVHDFFNLFIRKALKQYAPQKSCQK